MLGALLTFLVLFALIKVFERKRDDLDNFNIGTVADVPVLSVIAVLLMNEGVGYLLLASQT